MHRKHSYVAVSAIIPAYNEQETVAAIIETVQRYPIVDEVIVVDDGSTDLTAHNARKAGAKVISLEKNFGKGFALSQGVELARNDVILFLDADIVGLTHAALSRLIDPVVAGRFDMHVAICGRRTYWLNKLLPFFPILGGWRVLTRDIWESVPDSYKHKFQIELALNCYARKLGKRMGVTVVHGLRQVIKEKKRGLIVGLFLRALMIKDICLVSCRLYIVDPIKIFYHRLPKLIKEGFTKE